MTIWYPDLADYLAIAAEVTGLDAKVLTLASTVNLADSALHAPSTIVMAIANSGGPRIGSDRSNGRFGLFPQAEPSPLRDGTCHFSKCGCKSSADDTSSVQVRPNTPALPKLLRTSDRAVDPSRHCHCSGAVEALR